MKKVVSLLMVLILIFAFIGCQDNVNEVNVVEEVVNEATNEVANDENVEVVEEEVSKYPLTIIDGMDREVTIESEPQSIISLAPSTTEIIYAIGLGDKLIGRTDYCNFPAEVENVESVGTLREPNIESIIALNPDLIVASTIIDEEVVAKFEEVGINVVILIAQETFDGVYSILNQAGDIFNVTEKATSVIESMKEEVSSTMSIVAGVDKKSVYYVVGFGEYGDYTATGDTFIHEMLEMAGGSNIAADATGWSYNIESIIEKDPEIIICSENWDTKTLLETTEGYMELSAAKEGRIMEINQDLLSRQGPRLAEALTAVAKLLHPELFN